MITLESNTGSPRCFRALGWSRSAVVVLNTLNCKNFKRPEESFGSPGAAPGGCWERTSVLWKGSS